MSEPSFATQTPAPSPSPSPTTPTPTTPTSADPVQSAAASLYNEVEPLASDGGLKPAEPAKPVEAKPPEPAKPEAKALEPKTPEPKPADAKAPEAPKDGDFVPLTSADIQISLPEGVTLEEGSLTNFLTFANEAKLTKDQGQALMRMHVEQVNSVAEAALAQSAKAWQDTQQGWLNAISSDPDIGGAKSAGVQTLMAKAFEQFGSPEAVAAFDLTGAGNHPAVVKMFHKLAQAAVEDHRSLPGGLPVKRGPQTLGDALYGDN